MGPTLKIISKTVLEQSAKGCSLGTQSTRSPESAWLFVGEVEGGDWDRLRPEWSEDCPHLEFLDLGVSDEVCAP